MTNHENKQLPNFKCIVIGSSGVGKTSLITYLAQGSFDENTKPTINIDFQSVVLDIDGQDIKMNIFDTAGQEKYTSITRTYYRDAKCVLLVFDVTDKESYDDANKWFHEISQYCDPNAIILFVGNKTDEVNSRVITAAEAELYAKSRDVNYIETSAKNGFNVKEAFCRIAAEAYRGTSKKENDQENVMPIKKLLEQHKCC